MKRNPSTCPLCTTNHNEVLENSSSKTETELESSSVTFPSAGDMSHSFYRRVLKLLQSRTENLQFAQKTMNKMNLYVVNLIKKCCPLSINIEVVHKRVGFQCIHTTFARHYIQLFHKLSARTIEPGVSLGGSNMGKILPINVPKIDRRNFRFSDEKLSKSSILSYLAPGLYPSTMDIVEAKNRFIQQRHTYTEIFTTIEVFRKTQKIESQLANEGSGLVFFSTRWGEIFGDIVDNASAVLLRGKGTHKREIAYDIVRIHPLVMYTDLIEYSIVRDTTAPLFCCLFVVWKFQAGDFIFTGQYMNYQIISNLKFRPLLKNSFQSTHIDLRDISGEKLPFVSIGITRFVLMFREASNFHF